MLGVVVGLIIWGAALQALLSATPAVRTAVPAPAMSEANMQGLAIRKPLIPIKGDSLSVIGRVVDVDGEPVEGVAVFLRDAAPTLSPESKYQPVITDRNGWFQFFNLTPGRYTFITIRDHSQLSGVEIIPMLAHGSRLHVRIIVDVNTQVI